MLIRQCLDQVYKVCGIIHSDVTIDCDLPLMIFVFEIILFFVIHSHFVILDCHDNAVK